MDTLLIVFAGLETILLMGVLYFLVLIYYQHNPNEKNKKPLSYFRTPSDDGFELDWVMRQFFRLFSTAASERWYEARCLIYQSVGKSLLCAFGFINIVQYDFYTDDDGRIKWYTEIIIGFKNTDNFRKEILSAQNMLRVREKYNKVNDPHQIFIAGQNVVSNGW